MADAKNFKPDELKEKAKKIEKERSLMDTKRESCIQEMVKY